MQSTLKALILSIYGTDAVK